MANGQNYADLFKIDYTIGSQHTFDLGETSSGLREINADLTFPIINKQEFKLLSGFIYESTSAQFNPERIKENITGLTMKVGAKIDHNSKWSGTYLFLPKISSDFKNINTRDFQYGAVVLMSYQKSNNLTYRFGLYSNRELFGPFFVPIFGFYYLSPNKKFETKAVLPLSMDLNYGIFSNVRLGLNFRGQVRSYNLNTPFGNEAERYIHKSSQEIYSYFQYGLSNGIHFQFSLGRSIGRYFRIYEEKVSAAIPLVYFGDDRTQLNTDFSNGWLFKLAAFYRFIPNN